MTYFIYCVVAPHAYYRYGDVKRTAPLNDSVLIKSREKFKSCSGVKQNNKRR